MTKYTFVKIPGYDTWTGDKRVCATRNRKEFAAFVINLDTMKGSGVKGPTLAEVKKSVEYFNKHYKWPDGSIA